MNNSARIDAIRQLVHQLMHILLEDQFQRVHHLLYREVEAWDGSSWTEVTDLNTARGQGGWKWQEALQLQLFLVDMMEARESLM